MRPSPAALSTTLVSLAIMTSASAVLKRQGAEADPLSYELGCDGAANAPKCQEEMYTNYDSGISMVYGVEEM